MGCLGAGLPLHVFHQLPWTFMAMTTVTLHDTGVDITMALPLDCYVRL